MNPISYRRWSCVASPCPILLAITLTGAGCAGDDGAQSGIPAVEPPVDASSEDAGASFGADSGLLDVANDGGSGDAAPGREPVDGSMGAEVPAYVVDIELAPKARVTVDLLVAVGVVPAAVRDSGPGVLAMVDGGQVWVDALRSARGGSYVLVDTAAGEVVRLDVTFSSVPWAFLEGTPLVATLVQADEPAASTAAWSVDGDVMYGTRFVDGTSTGFAFEPGGALSVLPLPPETTGAKFRHFREDAIWGAVALGGRRLPATFSPEGTASPVEFPVDAEWFAGRDGRRVGAAWIDGVQRAIVCGGDLYETCRDVSPPEATEASARDLDSEGRTYGCAMVDGVQRAFAHTESTGSALLDVPSHGCISGIGDDGRLVGDNGVLEDGDGIVVDRPSSTVHTVRVGQSWGTRLLGVSGATLVGAVRAETGLERAVWLMPAPPVEGASYQPAPEPADPHIDHSCGHTDLGPFASINAAPDPERAGAIDRTHTNYTVSLPSDGQPARLRLVNARAGQITLYLSSLFGVKLFGPDGAPRPAMFADSTTRCEGLRGFVQYDLVDIGTYVLELEPTDHDRVNVVYERTWVVEPG